MSEELELFDIQTIFGGDKYVIPIYQRNYAWRNPEITQLIQDIVDYIKKDDLPITKKPNYYIGTLVVYKRGNNEKREFEIIDGQQRLTTLAIILSLIKNEYKDISWYQKTNLSFDSREISTKTLEDLFNGEELNAEKEYNVDIKQGYEDAKKILSKIPKDFGLSVCTFYEYLTQLSEE